MTTYYEMHPSGPLPAATYVIRGHLAEMLMESLSACPTFERNGMVKMRFQADVVDARGTLRQVTVWDAAARVLLQLTGADLQALWADCEEMEGQAAFLRAMNTSEDVDYDLVVEVVLREWKGKYSYHVNVIAANNAPPE